MYTRHIFIEHRRPQYSMYVYSMYVYSIYVLCKQVSIFCVSHKLHRYVWSYACLYVCMYVCVYVCMYCAREVIKTDINGHFVQFSVCVNLKKDHIAAK